MIKVESLVEGQGELHHAQTWPQMTATIGDHLQVTLTNLCSDLFQLLNRLPMELIGMGQLA